MKHLTYGITLGIITILLIFIFVTIMGRDVRTNETDQGLTEAVDSTLQGMFDEDIFYTVDNQEEFTGSFLQRLFLQIESDSDVEMSVVSADKENGILSVKITEHYKHPNGKEGTTECYKTIFKDSGVVEDTKMVKVYFYGSKEDMEAGNNPLMEVENLSGTEVYQPDVEEKEGYTFEGFADKEGNLFTDETALEVKEGETVTEYSYYAVYV